jgi:hypothetical protein
LAAQEDVPGRELNSAGDSDDASSDEDLSDDEVDTDFNPNKPASAPNYDEETIEDGRPLRLIMVLQKPEVADASSGALSEAA